MLRKLCSAIREGVTVDNSCNLFTAVNHLYGADIDEESPLEEPGEKLEEVQRRIFLLLSHFRQAENIWVCVSVLNYSGVVSYSSSVHENDYYHYQT